MKKILTLLCSGFMITLSSIAQPALEWGQRYNGPNDNSDEAQAIAVDNSGNVYVTGYAFNANGTLDMVTIKYSPTGQQLWLQSYNGSANDNDQARDIKVDASGNVYVTGYSVETGTMGDITTIKYTSSGVQSWVAHFNNTLFNNYDEGNALVLDASGNVYVTGYETDTNYTYNFVTLKYDNSGNQLWVKTYDGPGHFNDESRDIDLDANGNVYVTGPSDTFYAAQPNADIVLIKYDNNGNFQWRRVYDSPGHGYEWSKKLTIDRNNDIAVVGYGFVTGNGNDYLILKWSSAGNFQWYQHYNYGPNTFEEPFEILSDSLNNIIVAGKGITSTSTNTNDYVTVKYNSTGTFQWASRYNGPANNEDRGLAATLDDSLNIFVTGYSKGNGTNFDIATVKYDPAGNQVYVLRFDNTGVGRDDAGNAVLVKNGIVYITGRSANLVNDDYITLKYSYSAVGINSSTASSYNISTFPNPASGEVNISIPDLNLKNVRIDIYNSMGELINNPSINYQKNNSSGTSIYFDVHTLPAGVYFVKIQDNSVNCGVVKLVVQ
ncbi:MAG: SBBP repeat-containing protein [Bacteroidetes bacterium]|nr:SBBP repeat-containing protein [Bacteroidota bacterium]